MQPAATKRIAINLVSKYIPLHGYEIKMANSLDWAGLCDFENRVIKLSMEHTQAYNPEQVTQIALHEIAHAIRGPVRSTLNAGHDAEWLKAARRIGYEHGEIVPSTFPRPKIVWNTTCTKTGVILQRTTQPEPDFCNICNTTSCTPIIERRQLVKAHLHNIEPAHHWTDTLDTLTNKAKSRLINIFAPRVDNYVS